MRDQNKRVFRAKTASRELLGSFGSLPVFASQEVSPATKTGKGTSAAPAVASVDPRYRSPRATVRTFLIAMNRNEDDPRIIEEAVACLDSRSRLPRDQRSTTESTEIHGKENPNQLPISVSFPGAGPRRRVVSPARSAGSFHGYALVMIFLAWVIWHISGSVNQVP